MWQHLCQWLFTTIETSPSDPIWYIATSYLPLRHLYDNGDKASFLNLTGFERGAFEELNQYFYGDVQEQTGSGRILLLSDSLFWMHSDSMQPRSESKTWVIIVEGSRSIQ